MKANNKRTLKKLSVESTGEGGLFQNEIEMSGQIPLSLIQYEEQSADFNVRKQNPKFCYVEGICVPGRRNINLSLLS
jgi:hypothetical protein